MPSYSKQKPVRSKIYVHLQFALIAFVSKRSNKSGQALSSQEECDTLAMCAMLCLNSPFLYSFCPSYFVKQGITTW